MNNPTTLKKTSTGLLSALALAGGTSAYAAVVNVSTPADLTNVPGGANTMVNWDVNSDGINDFIFTNRYPNTAVGDSGVVWQLNMTGAVTTSGTVGYAGPFIRYAFALTAGTSIGSGSNFNSGGQTCLGSRYSAGSAGVYNYGGFAAGGPNGSVTPGTFAFAGFRFNAADGTHYGWVRLAVNGGIIDFANPIAAAYESTPGTAIAAGATAVPEPGTLALLALGATAALGSVVKRRRA